MRNFSPLFFLSFFLHVNGEAADNTSQPRKIERKKGRNEIKESERAAAGWRRAPGDPIDRGRAEEREKRWAHAKLRDEEGGGGGGGGRKKKLADNEERGTFSSRLRLPSSSFFTGRGRPRQKNETGQAGKCHEEEGKSGGDKRGRRRKVNFSPNGEKEEEEKK